ncbi:MAG: NYN domain-containing protein [Nocardioidaceae bacterium]
MSVPLPGSVRARVVALAAEALGEMEPTLLPPSLRRVATFAPTRRARLAGTQIAAVLAADEDFRDRVAVRVGAALPGLAEVVVSADPVPAADPVDVAALLYLLRPEDWQERLDAVVGQVEAESATEPAGAGRSDLERLERQAEASTLRLREAQARHREVVADLKAENAELRRRLGETRSRLRDLETALEQVEALGQERAGADAARLAEAEADLRRTRARAQQLEGEVGAARRAGRTERGHEALRARLLLDTLLETAQGLRRELALPAVEGSPADAVEAQVAAEGFRAGSGHGSLPVDDPALLEQLLGLPRVHLVVDGYNVTKAAWPQLSLEQQRDRLLSGLAPVAARSGAEVTVVFDAGAASVRPLVTRPRGVRVLYSRPGVIADDVIRDLVAAEPQGRPLVVVSSDREVVGDVVRAGARTVAAPALHRLLARA